MHCELVQSILSDIFSLNSFVTKFTALMLMRTASNSNGGIVNSLLFFPLFTGTNHIFENILIPVSSLICK